MNGEFLNIRNEQLEKLKLIFPESVTEGKIDLEKFHSIGEKMRSDLFSASSLLIQQNIFSGKLFLNGKDFFFMLKPQNI